MAPVEEHREHVGARVGRSNLEHRGRFAPRWADVLKDLGDDTLGSRQLALLLQHALEQEQGVLRRDDPRLQQQAEQLVPAMVGHGHERLVADHRHCGEGTACRQAGELKRGKQRVE
eukprot:scaffold51904_cov63-Phaeocystis_antarctica.AAC.1